MQEIHTDAVLSADTPESPDTGIDLLLQSVGAASRHIALLAAWIAMCGSLFFSEVYRWPPCVLCWYQRILMYPLTIILAIGILRRDRQLHLYAFPFALPGAFLSLYHYLLTKTDLFPEPPCSAAIPCSVDYLNILGFINIPFLALTAFLIISMMLGTWALYSADIEDPEAHPADQGTLPPASLRARLTTPDSLASLAAGAIMVLVVIGFLAFGIAEMNRINSL